jgi:hypothetical protein
MSDITILKLPLISLFVNFFANDEGEAPDQIYEKSGKPKVLKFNLEDGEAEDSLQTLDENSSKKITYFGLSQFFDNGEAPDEIETFGDNSDGKTTHPSQFFDEGESDDETFTRGF